MLLHMTIVGMTWRWLRHLLGPGGERCAWICAAVFAIHWYATEAATYIAALGVLWSMLGGLWSCFGVIMMRHGRPILGLLLLWMGMAVALGGGEYGMATVPLILVTAAATSTETSWTARSLRAVRIVCDLGRIAPAKAEAILNTADGSVKLAVLMARRKCGPAEGRKILDKAGGSLREAMG